MGKVYWVSYNSNFALNDQNWTQTNKYSELHAESSSMIQIDYIFWFSIDLLLVHVSTLHGRYEFHWIYFHFCLMPFALDQIDTYHFLIGALKKKSTVVWFVINHYNLKGAVAKNNDHETRSIIKEVNASLAKPPLIFSNTTIDIAQSRKPEKLQEPTSHWKMNNAYGRFY